MQSKYFEHNGLLISYLDCFKQCKHIKIEDEQTAKICMNCIRLLTDEYTLKQLNDQANYLGSVENNLDMPIASIKKEPEPTIDSWYLQKYEQSTTNNTPKISITISGLATNFEDNSINAKPMVETVSTANQMVFLPVADIKEEIELQIIDEADPSLNLTRSCSPG
jgi:hypothetical protein